MSNRFLIGALVAAWLLSHPATSQAQTSIYSSMTVAGTWQGFNPAQNNMRLVSNELWQADFFITAMPTNKFKFAANGSWNVNWGLVNQTNFSVPQSSPVQFNAADILHTNVLDGYYRFTFNSSTYTYSLTLLGHSRLGSNLLNNASFETPGTSPEEAYFWQTGNPDYHGGRWGSSQRADWRSVDGSWQATIGTYPDNFGGWWQEVPAGPEFDYELSATFWADYLPPYGPWTAAVQELKMEFYGPQYGNPLSVVATNFHDVVDNFVTKSVKARGPSGTAWARFVMSVSGAGTNGALQFDVASLVASPLRSQGFDQWTFASNNGTHIRGDWRIENGRVTAAEGEVFAGRSVSLANPGGGSSGGFIRSPRFADGIGRISFQYRHGGVLTNELDEITNAITLRVETSPDGSSWSTLVAVTNILSTVYKPFSIFHYDPNPTYVRVIHAGSTNRLLLDDISVAIAEPVSRFQDFNNWDNSATNLGVHTNVEWLVSNGVVSAVNALDGKSALIKGSTNSVNYVRTPLFGNGHGQVNFSYRRGASGSAPVNMVLEASTNGANWFELDRVTNITAVSYQTYSTFFYYTNAAFIRLRNEYVPVAPGGPTEVINEGFDAGATPPPGWTFTSIGTYDTSGNYGKAPPSLRFDATGDRVLTPVLTAAPSNMTFWTKGQSASAGSFFLVESSTNGGATWTTNLVLQPIINSQRTNSLPLATNVNRLRFTYNKDAGNLSFDDLYVIGPPAGAQPPQDLLVDNIDVANPLLTRSQNFDAWPAVTTFTDSEFQGWKVVDGRVDSVNPLGGQSARLDSSPVGNQYIQSPYYSDGIGAISFWYARDTSGGADPVYNIQLSTNGTNWVTIDSISVSSSTFQKYTRYNFTTNGQYVRLFHPSGANRVSFDDIVISPPQPPANVTLNAYTDPAFPWREDKVHIIASATPQFDAENVTVTSYYRIGTSGAFSVKQMTLSNFIQYQTTTPIPAQPTGTVVQYYLQSTFQGPGAASNLPKYFPPGGPTNPASYAIARTAPGKVWINEVKYQGYFFDQTTEFIELAGPTGFNISGWSIELAQGGTESTLLIGRYVLPTTTLLSASATNIGFWVLGGANVAERNMLLTNDLHNTPLGIRLLNEVKGVEQAISLDGYISFYRFVPALDDFFEEQTGISLVGTGTTYHAFSWDDYVTLTPGAINAGQAYNPAGDPPFVPPTNIFLVDLWQSGTTNYLVAYGNTNDYWHVAPYYTTNLASGNWIPLTPYFMYYAGYENVMWFAPPTGNVPYIYRVMMTPHP